MKNFDCFLSQLQTTNATLDFFVDFKKIIRNIDLMRIKLNQLNFLIGYSDLEEAIKLLFNENPNCFSILSILIAVRDGKIFVNDAGEFNKIESMFKSANDIYEYINKTGLAEILQNKHITNLVDYVFGVEVGLDTNARKNRSGSQMSALVASMFTKNNIPFEQEVSSKKFDELHILGFDNKVFDFVIKTRNKTYLTEVNFYSSGGSKLNEVARSYVEISSKINSLDGYEFVWITDGEGWLSAKNKLQEAYTQIPKVFNLITLKDFISSIS